MRRPWAVALASAACGILTACAGDGPPAVPPASSFDVIQQTIFNPNCLSAGCHNAVDRANNLVLEAAQSFGNLVNVLAFNEAARADGLQRVQPGNADASFLFIKVTNPSAVQGTRMPQGAAALSSADIETIRAWILAGAPPPGTPTPSAAPTVTPPLTPTPAATATRTMIPSPTPSPTITATGTRPPTSTPTPTPPPTLTPTLTLTPSATFTARPTATPAIAPTPTFSVESTFPAIQATIFNTTCLDIGCHNNQSMAGNQVLEPDNAYANLVGVVPFTAAAAQLGLLRVDPGKPDNSFLLTKLTLPTVFDPEFLSRMPLGKPPLPPAQIEQIRAWILRGALPDEQP